MPSEAKSKFLSYILRHRPDEIGLILDPSGWAEIDALVFNANLHGRELTRDEVITLSIPTDKKRFEISPDGKRIRAIHGHSVQVDLQYIPQQPPNILYHGTATRFLSSINEKGILSAERQYVHLSTDTNRALEVARRHGKPVLLIVNAQSMFEAGYQFFLSENGIWLTKIVPLGFFHQQR